MQFPPFFPTLNKLKLVFVYVWKLTKCTACVALVEDGVITLLNLKFTSDSLNVSLPPSYSMAQLSSVINMTIGFVST